MIRSSGGRHMPAYHRPPTPKPDNPARDIVQLFVLIPAAVLLLAWIGGLLP